jgi:hypothetical protein
MVLPDRIELSTSPLPRGCSTTELRQRPLASREGRDGTARDIHDALAIDKASGPVDAAPMNEPPRVTPARQAERAARDKRLAEALRANLRRRKEQARAREDAPPPEPRDDKE